MDKKFKNGQKVRERLSGFEGTITAEIEYMNGCIRYQIQPRLLVDGTYQDSVIIDEQQLDLLVERKLFKEKKDKKDKEPPGGDRPGLPKYTLGR